MLSCLSCLHWSILMCIINVIFKRTFPVPVLKGLVGSFSKPKSWINIPKHALCLCSMLFWDKCSYLKAELLDQKRPLSMFQNHSAREIYQNLVWIRIYGEFCLIVPISHWLHWELHTWCWRQITTMILNMACQGDVFSIHKHMITHKRKEIFNYNNFQNPVILLFSVL